MFWKPKISKMSSSGFNACKLLLLGHKRKNLFINPQTRIYTNASNDTNYLPSLNAIFKIFFFCFHSLSLRFFCFCFAAFIPSVSFYILFILHSSRVSLKVKKKKKKLSQPFFDFFKNYFLFSSLFLEVLNLNFLLFIIIFLILLSFFVFFSFSSKMSISLIVWSISTRELIRFTCLKLRHLYIIIYGKTTVSRKSKIDF